MTAPSTITLRLLGAGGAFSKKFGTTCSTLRIGGELWLVDCGRQAPDQLVDAGLSWHQIDGQLVTHVHGDHTYGLEEFAFARYFLEDRGVAPVRAGGPRPKLVCHTAVREELWDSLRSSLRYTPDGPSPTGGTLQTYFDAIDPSASEAPRGNAWPHAEEFSCGAMTVRARETVHVPGKPSTSFEFDVGQGRVAWWSGDSTVDIDFLTGLEPRATVFFHDCTFIEYPGQVHGAFGLLERLPHAVRKKMVLMHHEDDLEQHRARAEALGFRVALPGDSFDLVTGVRCEVPTQG